MNDPRPDTDLPIPALAPRMPGHSFVFYADSCSGVPGQEQEAILAQIHRAIGRLSTPPEFLLFAGDHIAGQDGAGSLARQWRHFLEHELRPVAPWPIYHATGNHTVFDARSRRLFQRLFPDLPDNGPPHQKGLTYRVRRGDLRLVVLHTPAVDLAWLDAVLSDRGDAACTLVVGHHPVHPVNGYADERLWTAPSGTGRALWDLLVRHAVTAYLCSHVLAFDVQVHQGVLQITSGGAGAKCGPGGLMPAPAEYHHFVQMAVDAAGLRCQAIDLAGRMRESLVWPMPEPEDLAWFTPASDFAAIAGHAGFPDPAPGTASILRLHIRGRTGERAGAQTLLCGRGRLYEHLDGPDSLWIGFENSALVVSLVPERGQGPQRWTGPVLAPRRPFEFELAIHGGMGPGGVLLRQTPDSPWSSLPTAAAVGAEKIVGPHVWSIGRGQFSDRDRVFRGRDLEVGLGMIRQDLFESGKGNPEMGVNLRRART